MVETLIKYDWNIGNGIYIPDNSIVSATIPNNPIFDITPSSEFSLSMFVKYNPVHLQTITLTQKRTPSPLTGFDSFIRTNEDINFRYWFNNSVQVFVFDTLSAMNINGIYHIVFTKGNTMTSTSLKLYINSVEQNIKSVTPEIFSQNLTNTEKIFLPYKLDNILFDWKYFNKELTADEIYGLYIKQGQLVPSTAIDNLKTNLTFNDKNGTIAKDSSGNGNDGVLSNFTSPSLGASNSWVDKNGNPITQY